MFLDKGPHFSKLHPHLLRQLPQLLTVLLAHRSLLFNLLLESGWGLSDFAAAYLAGLHRAFFIVFGRDLLMFIVDLNEDVCLLMLKAAGGFAFLTQAKISTVEALIPHSLDETS